jgi:hypothetical protein
MLNAFQSMEYENNKKYITNTANKRQKNEKKNRYILRSIGFSLGHIVDFLDTGRPGSHNGPSTMLRLVLVGVGMDIGANCTAHHRLMWRPGDWDFYRSSEID